jgi:hypothetical protein
VVGASVFGRRADDVGLERVPREPAQRRVVELVAAGAAARGVVSRSNDLVIPASPDPRRFDATAFALVSSADGPRAGGDAEVAFGNLAVVATLLPDLGQVEADPAQVNLTSFELFLPERRTFFTEGLDAFRFGAALPMVTRGDSFADEGPFYSRPIGRASTILAPRSCTGVPTTVSASACSRHRRWVCEDRSQADLLRVETDRRPARVAVVARRPHDAPRSENDGYLYALKSPRPVASTSGLLPSAAIT